MYRYLNILSEQSSQVPAVTRFAKWEAGSRETCKMRWWSSRVCCGGVSRRDGSGHSGGAHRRGDARVAAARGGGAQAEAGGRAPEAQRCHPSVYYADARLSLFLLSIQTINFIILFSPCSGKYYNIPHEMIKVFPFLSKRSNYSFTSDSLIF